MIVLTQKRPNEMRGKPLIERLLPGIALQIQRKGDNILVDFNPYIGYRPSGLAGNVVILDITNGTISIKHQRTKLSSSTSHP